MMTSWRGMIGKPVLLVALLIAAAACTPAATPSQTTSPSKSTAPSAPAASPSASSGQAPSASPEQTAEWKAKWDELVIAAKKEGKLSVTGPRGDQWRDAVLAFQTAYPAITVEYVGASASDTGPKILAERRAGIYAWDVSLGGPNTVRGEFIPANYIAPLREAIILPEVLDSSKWRQGFDDGFLDEAGKYSYGFGGELTPFAWVNRDVVPNTELRTMDELLEPRWKGKIGIRDVRKAVGSSTKALAVALKSRGEEWVRKLLAQDLVVKDDPRMHTEGLIRGGHVVAIGVAADQVAAFKPQGLWKGIEPLEPDNPNVWSINFGNAAIALFEKPANPNAQKLFANWYLSREGQEAVVRSVGTPSRRLDVSAVPDITPKPNVTYVSMDKPENEEFQPRVAQIAKEYIK